MKALKWIGGILALALIIVITYWFMFIRLTKEKAITEIVKAGMHANENNFLDTFDEGMLIEWAKAIRKADSANFTYSGKKYAVKGGKAL